MPTTAKLARVLFDEAHSEAWTIRDDVASELQPAHPADSSLAAAARALAERDFDVAINSDQKLTTELLREVDVLVIAHPSDPKWEATVPGGTPRLEPAEIEAVDAFVRAGGGLLVLGETEQDKYGNNVNELLGRFGIEVANCTVQDYEHHREAPSWVLAQLDPARDGEHADVLARVREVCFYRAGALRLADGALPIARTYPTASVPDAPLAAIGHAGKGRVAALADSDLFGDDCIDDLDNRQLWLNLVYWSAQAAFAGDDSAPDSPARRPPRQPRRAG